MSKFNLDHWFAEVSINVRFITYRSILENIRLERLQYILNYRLHNFCTNLIRTIDFKGFLSELRLFIRRSILVNIILEVLQNTFLRSSHGWNPNLNLNRNLNVQTVTCLKFFSWYFEFWIFLTFIQISFNRSISTSFYLRIVYFFNDRYTFLYQTWYFILHQNILKFPFFPFDLVCFHDI